MIPARCSDVIASPSHECVCSSSVSIGNGKLSGKIANKRARSSCASCVEPIRVELKVSLNWRSNPTSVGSRSKLSSAARESLHSLAMLIKGTVSRHREVKNFLSDGVAMIAWIVADR